MFMHRYVVAVRTMVAPDEGRSNADDRLSIRVINAIAEHEGTTATEIRPVLYDIIDPDALDSLFSATHRGEARADGNVEFQYGPHKVTVHSDGTNRYRARSGFPIPFLDIRNSVGRQLTPTAVPPRDPPTVSI